MSLQVEELESLDAATEDEIGIEVQLGFIAASILFGIGLAIT